MEGFAITQMKQTFIDLGISLITSLGLVITYVIGSILVQEVNDKKDFDWIALIQRKSTWILEIAVFVVVFSQRIIARKQKKKMDQQEEERLRKIVKDSFKQYILLEDAKKSLDAYKRISATEKKETPSQEKSKGDEPNGK